MQVSNATTYSYSNVLFEARTPSKRALSSAKDKLGPRPSKELLEELINNGLNNQEIATKLKRAVQTIVGLRWLYKLPSEHDTLVQKRTPLIIERLMAGINRADIAKEFGVSTGTINVIAEKFKTFDACIIERDKKICQMFHEGYLRKDIAKTLGISVDTVRRTLKANNLAYNARHGSHDFDILKKLQNNESNKQIMEDLNISANPILRVKKQLGITKQYNRSTTPQVILWTEVMEESKKVTELRKDFKILKQGERNLEVLNRISETLDQLKNKIEEFKSRLQQPNID